MSYLLTWGDFSVECMTIERVVFWCEWGKSLNRGVPQLTKIGGQA